MELKVVFKFDAAHKLEDYNGECQGLHGHTWKVVVILSGNIRDAVDGILVDFKLLKEAIRNILPDHKYLNDFYGLRNPTAEVLSCILFTKIRRILKVEFENLVSLVSVEVWESDTASAKVYNEQI